MVNKPPSRNPVKSTPISVMVVEDDVSLRDILTTWIQEAPGFELIAVFSDVESALKPIGSRKPDIALVDINLPGMNGIECVRALKPVTPETQFVMLTVYEDSNYIFDALSAGATGYLVKRTPRAALIAALREVHDGGSPMSSNIARKVVQSLHQPNPSMPPDTLSQRESEALGLLAQGYLNKEIAHSMNISIHSVNTYIRRIYEKLHVHSRTQAIAVLKNLPRPRPPK